MVRFFVLVLLIESLYIIYQGALRIPIIRVQLVLTSHKGRFLRVSLTF